MPELLPMLQDNSVLNENTVSIRNLIVNIIPDDVITPFNTNNILQLIFLACFFGVMLNRAGEYAAWAKDGVKFLSRFTVMPPMLSGLGIPPTAVTHFIGIEPILDMFGTAQSVVGNITSAFIITNLENKIDDKIYRAHK